MAAGRVSRSPTTPSPRPATGCSSWRPRTTPAPRRCRPGPHFADEYVDALAANGQQADVYDVDAAGRLAPDALGVLSHYDAVFFETGNDLVYPRRGRAGGNADRLALDELLELRSYLNEGGKVLLGGDAAGEQYTSAAVGNQLYDPQGQIACNPLPAGTDPRRCLPLWGSSSVATQSTTCCSTTWGAYVPSPTTARAMSGSRVRRGGRRRPVHRARVGPRRPHLRGQHVPEVVVHRDQRHPPSRPYKQFESRPSRTTTSPADRSPPTPVTSTSSPDRRRLLQTADPHDRRAGRRSVADVLDVYAPRARIGTHLFVEARTPGGEDWTTLPDANAHTTQDPGLACPQATSGGWRTLHPHLDHYQTQRAPRRVVPPAPPAPGTPQAATPVAVQRRINSRRTQAAPSRSRSPAPATGRRRGPRRVVDDVTLRTGPAPRSRPVSTAGRSPDHPKAADPTSTTSSGPTRRASPSGTPSPRRTRCCWGSVSRDLDARRTHRGDRPRAGPPALEGH